MKKYYQICGIPLSIEMEDNLWSPEQRNLAAFETEPTAQTHSYRFECRKSLDSPEGECLGWADNMRIYAIPEGEIRYIGASEQDWNKAYIRVKHMNKHHEVQVLRNPQREKIGSKTVLTALGLEYLLAQHQSVLLHCSCIEYGGQAIVFTAPSQTGKSTQANLWENLRGARIINGDRAALRIMDGKVMAAGIPFAGSSQYCLNEVWPLKAIVSLGQSKESRARFLTGAAAFMKVWAGCTVNVWDKEQVARLSDCLREMVSQVPVIRLDCRPDETAIAALEALL